MNLKISIIWKNRNKIKEGILNNIFKKDHVEDIALYRLNICKECDKYSMNSDNCMVAGTQPCCSDCGCSLNFKIRSLSSSCSLEKPKWDAMLSEQDNDLLMDYLNSKK